MRNLITIFFVALLILIPEIGGAALSLETLEKVEQIRRKLAPTSTYHSKEIIVQHDSPVADIDDSDGGKDYVVGVELRQALQRYRKAVYKKTETATMEPVSTHISSTKVTDTTHEEKPNKQLEATEPYVPGQSLRQAIDKVKASRRPDDMNEDIIDVDQGLNTLNNDSYKEVSAHVPVKNDAIIDSTEVQQDDYVSSSFVKNMRLKSSPTNAIKAADDSVENSQTQKTQQDKKLNQELSRHEFRMPENYRIIVR